MLLEIWINVNVHIYREKSGNMSCGAWDARICRYCYATGFYDGLVDSGHKNQITSTSFNIWPSQTKYNTQMGKVIVCPTIWQPSSRMHALSTVFTNNNSHIPMLSTFPAAYIRFRHVPVMLLQCSHNNPNVYKIFLNVSKYYQIFQNVAECFKIFQNISKYYRIS